MNMAQRTCFHPSDFTTEELDWYLTRMFQISDENKDGVLQPDELRMLLSFSKFNIPADQIAQMVAAADANQDGVISYNEFVPVLRELMQALPMPDVLPSKPRAGLSVDTGFQPGMSVERDIDNTWYPAIVVESPPASPGQSPTYNIKYTDDAGNKEVGVEEDEVRVKTDPAEAAEDALSQVESSVSANLTACADAQRRAAMTAAHLPDQPISPCTAAQSASRVTEAMAAQIQAREQAAREQAMAAKAAADEAAAETALVEAAARTVLVTVHAAKGQFKVVCKPSDTVLQLKHKVTVAADAQCVDLSPWKSSSFSNCSIRIESRYMSVDNCELSVYGVQSGSLLYLEISPTQHSNQYRSRTAKYH